MLSAKPSKWYKVRNMFIHADKHTHTHLKFILKKKIKKDLKHLHNKMNYEFNDICNLFNYLSINCCKILFYLQHQAKEQFHITLES